MRKRKTNSITDKVYTYIGKIDVNKTFTVTDVFESGHLTCNSYYGPRQRVYDLLCMLNKTGLIKRVKRGTYEVMYNMPTRLTSSDVEAYCGYNERHLFFSDVSVKKRNPFDIDAYKQTCDLECDPYKEAYYQDAYSQDTYYKLTNLIYDGLFIYKELSKAKDDIPKYDFTNTFATLEQLKEFSPNCISEEDAQSLNQQSSEEKIVNESRAENKTKESYTPKIGDRIYVLFHETEENSENIQILIKRIAEIHSVESSTGNKVTLYDKDLINYDLDDTSNEVFFSKEKALNKIDNLILNETF